MSGTRYLTVFFGTFLLLALGLGGFNAYVDPFGIWGSGRFPPLVTNNADRYLKVKLLEKLPAPPKLLILGSSRTHKFDPLDIQREFGIPAFNASVGGATILDAFTFSKLAMNLSHGKMPLVLWGVDIEMFMKHSVPAALISNPELRVLLPLRDFWECLVPKYLEFLGLSMTVRSVELLRLVTAKKISGNGLNYVGNFTPLGFRKWDGHDEDMIEVPNVQFRLKSTLHKYTAQFYNANNPVGVDPDEKRRFETTLSFLNRAGVKPLLFLTPVHPIGRDGLSAFGWGTQYRRVKAYLASLKGSYDFRLFDFTDPTSYGGDLNEFSDVFHVTVRNNRQVLAELKRRNAF